jgi:hypothetical protein
MKSDETKDQPLFKDLFSKTPKSQENNEKIDPRSASKLDQNNQTSTDKNMTITDDKIQSHKCEGSNKVNLEKLKILYLTNDANAIEILTSGLLKPSEGYPKYYSDLLQSCPGKILVFFQSIPEGFIKDVLMDDSDLKPVIFEIDPQKIQVKNAFYFLSNGDIVSAPFPYSDKIDPVAMAFSGAMPISVANYLIFNGKSDEKKFKSLEYGNVDCSSVKTKSNKSMFNQKSSKFELAIKNGLGERDVPKPELFRHAESRAGILHHIIHALEDNDSNRKKIKLLLESMSGSLNKNDPIFMSDEKWFHGLLIWIESKQTNVSGDVEYVVLKSALDFLSDRDKSEGLSYEFMIDRIREEINKYVDDDRLKMAMIERLDLIEKVMSFDGIPPEEFLSKSKSTVLRGLMFFMLYRNLETMNLSLDKAWPFSDSDLVMARIFIGAWEGWNGISVEERGTQDECKIITQYMAGWLNRQIPGVFEVIFDCKIPVPQKPLTLSQLFEKGRWTLAKENAATEMSRLLEWNCMETSIRANEDKIKGYEVNCQKDQEINIKVMGMCIVKTKVIQKEFMMLLVNAYISPDLDTKIRKLLSSK